MSAPPAHVKVSAEVQEALSKRVPVVALETSVVAQGLPYPTNLEAARRCEEAVRGAGAVPAAIGVIEGVLHVGLDAPELRALAQGEPSVWKLASRDLCVAMAKKASGGVTVSATCELAAACGIPVFSTGGIGGVHRGVGEHGDVSQDLHALARFPVAVVCAGAKSVLDLPKTLEMLETLGVPVVGVGTEEFPSFYSRSSGLPLEHAVATAREGAAILDARMRRLRQGGIVFAVPIPEEQAIPREEVERAIQIALDEAKRARIDGKKVTPFLLQRLSQHTGQRTLQANLALLESNARFAAELAVEYQRLV